MIELDDAKYIVWETSCPHEGYDWTGFSTLEDALQYVEKEIVENSGTLRGYKLTSGIMELKLKVTGTKEAR